MTDAFHEARAAESEPSPQALDGRMPRDREAERRGGTTNEGRRGVGLGFFLAYVVLYGGFIGIVLVRPQWLSVRPFGGVNLAIAYGMGLILAAVVLALGFMVVSRLLDGRSR